KAGAALDGIVAVVAGQEVAAREADQGVVAGAAVDFGVRGSGLQGIVAGGGLVRRRGRPRCLRQVEGVGAGVAVREGAGLDVVGAGRRRREADAGVRAGAADDVIVERQLVSVGVVDAQERIGQGALARRVAVLGDGVGGAGLQ